ncbi:MAG TPA: L-threonylcarbamoyladenylate synthase [Chloroflexota bacterium]|nr:L-threonylcarbamoyladenylate synthase [Chloroflexota bacterium]
MVNDRVASAADPANILRAAALLRESKVVVVPTDTVYGLAARVFDEEAVARVYRIKGREPEARVPVLLGSGADLSMVVSDVPRNAWKLIQAFWPGALTLVLPASPTVPRVITGGGPTIGVRVPANVYALQLLESLGEPIVGTSANPSGAAPALTAQEAATTLPDVDLVLEADASVAGGPASTVVQVGNDAWRLIRQGGIAVEDIRLALGPRVARVD